LEKLKIRNPKFVIGRSAGLIVLLLVVVPLCLGRALAQRDIGIRAKQPNPGNPFYGKSWAVLIGINEYEHAGVRKLRYAVNDVNAIEEALLDQGFERDRIFKLVDGQATKARVESLLGDELRYQVGKNDRVLVFFAGHGKTERLRSGFDEGYLVTVNGDPQRLFSTAISMETLRRISDRIPAKHILYIVDACYSGYAIYNRSLTSGLLDEMIRRPAIQILTAGRQQDQAQEKNGYGIFTQVLIRGLRGDAFSGKSWLALEELGVWLKQRVWAESGKRQLPQFGNLSGEGQFVFLTPKVSYPTPPSQVPSNHTDRVAALLKRAGGQFALNNLTTPPGNNAYQTLQQVLELAPGQPEALRKLQLVVDRYKTWAEQKMKSAQWEEAETYLKRAKRISSEDREVDQLMARVTLARQKPQISAQQPKKQAQFAVGLPANNRKGMVYVPAGWFFMGCHQNIDTQCKSNEKPAQSLYLDGFHIDALEVTAAEYRRCVAQRGCTTDGLSAYRSCNWNNAYRDRHPINCVSWYQAQAYCGWAGKRLPTEAEWEKAMRGTDGRKYPWGNRWSPDRANVSGGGPGRTTSVGSYPFGQSPYGARDMAGNVWEWVQPLYGREPYQTTRGRNTKESPIDGNHIVRGGSWNEPPWDARSSSRVRLNPASRNGTTGFRCAS